MCWIIKGKNWLIREDSFPVKGVVLEKTPGLQRDKTYWCVNWSGWFKLNQELWAKYGLTPSLLPSGMPLLLVSLAQPKEAQPWVEPGRLPVSNQMRQCFLSTSHWRWACRQCLDWSKPKATSCVKSVLRNGFSRSCGLLKAGQKGRGFILFMDSLCKWDPSKGTTLWHLNSRHLIFYSRL